MILLVFFLLKFHDSYSRQ